MVGAEGLPSGVATLATSNPEVFVQLSTSVIGTGFELLEGKGFCASGSSLEGSFSGACTSMEVSFSAGGIAGVPVATGGLTLGQVSFVEALGFIFFFVFLEDLVFLGSSWGSIGASDSLSSSSDEDVWEVWFTGSFGRFLAIVRKHEGSQPVGTLDCELYVRLHLSYGSQFRRTSAS